MTARGRAMLVAAFYTVMVLITLAQASAVVRPPLTPKPIVHMACTISVAVPDLGWLR